MGVSQQQMEDRIRELTQWITPPRAFDQAVSLMTDLLGTETVTFFMARRDLSGPRGEVTVDVVALTERRLVEIEFYRGDQSVRISSSDVSRMASVEMSTVTTAEGERTTVDAHEGGGGTYQWLGGPEAGEDLRALAAQLLQRAAT